VFASCLGAAQVVLGEMAQDRKVFVGGVPQDLNQDLSKSSLVNLSCMTIWLV